MVPFEQLPVIGCTKFTYLLIAAYSNYTYNTYDPHFPLELQQNTH
jgi:hypothetical protein